MRNRFLKSPFSRFLPRHRHSDTVRHSNMRTLIALVVLTLVLALVQAAKVEVEVTSVRKRGSGIGATGGAGRVRARHTQGRDATLRVAGGVENAGCVVGSPTVFTHTLARTQITDPFLALFHHAPPTSPIHTAHANRKGTRPTLAPTRPRRPPRRPRPGLRPSRRSSTTPRGGSRRRRTASTATSTGASRA